MKKFLFAFLLMSTLTGCAAGAFAAGGAAGGSLVSDGRGFQVMQKDNNITFSAEQLIVTDPDLKQQAHIVVATYNGVVLLTGEAPTTTLRDRAIELTKGVPGVKRIFDQIVIGQPISTLQRSRDAAITANVKARMLATTNLRSSQIKVVTENGTVFLMGLTTPKQAEIAAIVTSNSSGVKHVVKLIQYVYVFSDASTNQ